MTTPFTPNIPNTGQSLGITKNPIRNNFTAIVEDLDKNHIAIDATGRGKHKFLQMPVTTVPTVAANEVGVWSETVTTESVLFQKPNAAGPFVGFTSKTGTTVVPINATTTLFNPNSLLDATRKTVYGVFYAYDQVTPANFSALVFVFVHAGLSTILSYPVFPVASTPGGAVTFSFNASTGAQTSYLTTDLINIQCFLNYGAGTTIKWTFTPWYIE